MREEYVLDKVTELRKERNWSLYKLAKESDISYSTLSNTFRRNYVPTVSTLLRLCNGFGITLAEFFDEQHVLSGQLTVSDQQLLADWHRLSHHEKYLVISYINGLLKKPVTDIPQEMMLDEIITE